MATQESAGIKTMLVETYVQMFGVIEDLTALDVVSLRIPETPLEVLLNLVEGGVPALFQLLFDVF